MEVMSYIGPREPCDECGKESDVIVVVTMTVTAQSRAGDDAVLAEGNPGPRIMHLCAAHARLALR